MPKFENIFVTVGTTQFDALIEQFTREEISAILQKVNCKNLTLQIGKGKIDENKLRNSLPSNINVQIYELKASILNDIQQADLVISHAGAGSCIEVLKHEKPLLVIVNDELADNHQIELAEQLCNDGYLFYCSPKRLGAALEQFDVNRLKKYEHGNMKKFVKRLDEFMGFC